ncbi:M48 family peptidase [Oxalobacteraceae bacterium CAVE-383]|nr:M48 family peptidase [Oxalobacteraceae bacterium CAVE-383]
MFLPPKLRMALLPALLSVALLSPIPAPLHAQGLPTLGDTEREALSPLMERKVGEEIMRDIRRDSDYMDDPPLLEYLHNFGGTLVAARPDVRGEADYDFFFFAIRDPVLNAFALPGGFIGVQSGLILAAQSESELASVLSHEIGHVAQRHIARMLGQAKGNTIIQLAAMLLGALSMHSGSDAGMGVMLGGTGLAMQRQLNFSRDAEREADRVGLQILREGGFDTSGMVAFFGRLQSASRSMNDSVPPYLLTHPLTSERIADIEARIRDRRYFQRRDNPDYQLIRARVRVLQGKSNQDLLDAQVFFQNQLAQNSMALNAAAKYGMTLIALRQNRFDAARALLKEARALSVSPQAASSVLFAGTEIEIELAAKHPERAVALGDAARKAFPISRAISRQYASALIANRQYADAVDELRDQALLYRSDDQVQKLLAQAYDGQGRRALQHLALAESYALSGALPAAIQQLTIARTAPDATFYDHSLIDAREREWKVKYKEEVDAERK